MQVLITGRGSSGSWQIRGVQLGTAIGATVEPNASKVKDYGVAVVVKRPRADLLHRLHTAGVPIVWDVIDSWPQPSGNEWGREECLAWLHEQVVTIRPAGIVAATKAMALDCAGFGVPVLWLPHHARPGQMVNPIRDRVQTIGYEGGEPYLGHWRSVLEKESAHCGARFVCNPDRLSDLDIVVALRSSTGYAARNWKSNVKLANAQGSGTPIICNREAGYLETASSGEQWADTLDELRTALDSLGNRSDRLESGQRLQLAAPRLDSIANAYKTWLASRFF